MGFVEICLHNYANGYRKQPVPFLEVIWVNPEYRQQGFGRALINQITTDLILTGFDELCSDTDISNKPSQQAHENWGYAKLYIFIAAVSCCYCYSGQLYLQVTGIIK
ncbi:MAG: GNAT family N-acetyltransferase [Arsenophonus endosymbiont of Dermacentor nuttalli]